MTFELTFIHLPDTNYQLIQPLLQLLCTIDELCDPTFLVSDWFEEVVDDIDILLDWYHWIAWSGHTFAVPVYMFASLTCLFGSLMMQGTKLNVAEDENRYMYNLEEMRNNKAYTVFSIADKSTASIHPESIK